MDKIITIRLDESLVKKIDWCIERHMTSSSFSYKNERVVFTNRSHFIRRAIFKLLKEVEFKEDVKLNTVFNKLEEELNNKELGDDKSEVL
jgi:Arc/MetJ-type ribon-helix-helix transcriptional regulator